MKTKNLAYFLFFLILISVSANSSLIKVDINKKLSIEILSFNVTNRNGLLNFSFELYNTGSNVYRSRVRIDINNRTFWGKEEILYPGERKKTNVYAFINSSGVLKYRLRTYFAQEMIERFDNLKIHDIYWNFSNVFKIKNFRVHDKYVAFDLKPLKNFDFLAIIPYEYPAGWIFEQSVYNNIKAGKVYPLKIDYMPQVFYEDSFSFLVIGTSKNIIYVNKFDFILRKNKPTIFSLIQDLLDFIFFGN